MAPAQAGRDPTPPPPTTKRWWWWWWRRKKKSKKKKKKNRDWVGVWVGIATIVAIGLAGVPGLVALLNVNSANQQVTNQLQIANHQLQIAEQGQITDRYNAAITNLGSRSIEVRLGGIYALQRLMQDSPRDQSTVVAVLCAYVRDHSNEVTAKPPTLGVSPPVSEIVSLSRHSAKYLMPTDIQAALTAVATRDIAHDGPHTQVDFTGVNLTAANLPNAELSGATFYGANLADAILFNAKLGTADLLFADLRGVDFINANLTGADLDGADLAGASLDGADLKNVNITGFGARTGKKDAPNLTGASLLNVNLTGANLTGANLTGARLDSADLHGTYLGYVNLSGANLSGANLTGADFTAADLTGVNLSGATLTRVNLTGAEWSKNVPAPKGWVRDPSTGRLRRVNAST